MKLVTYDSGGGATREDATDAIFGYTIWNDFSARDVQRHEGAVGLGPGNAKDWDAPTSRPVPGPRRRVRRHADATMRVRVNR